MPTSNRVRNILLEPAPPREAEANAPSFRLVSSLRGGHRLLMAGDLDFAACDRLRRALSTLPSGADGQPLVLDLTDVTYLDCAAVKALLEARRVHSATRPLTFRFAEGGQPRRMLMLLGLEAVFGLPPTGPTLRYAAH